MAMPTARALVNRATVCLGLTASVAIAGCREIEADSFCYGQARDYAEYDEINAALSDGLLTQAECDRLIMPLVRASNEHHRRAVKMEALLAARAASDAERDEDAFQ